MAGNVDSAQIGAMRLQHHQCQHAVVHVVIGRAARERTRAPLGLHERVLRMPDVVARRLCADFRQIGRQRVVASAHGQQFHRLAELAAGDAPLPGPADAIVEFAHPFSSFFRARGTPWRRCFAALPMSHPRSCAYGC